MTRKIGEGRFEIYQGDPNNSWLGWLVLLFSMFLLLKACPEYMREHYVEPGKQQQQQPPAPQ
jgi:hypothetical protein